MYSPEYFSLFYKEKHLQSLLWQIVCNPGLSLRTVVCLAWCAGHVGFLTYFRAEPLLRQPPPAPHRLSFGTSSQLIMAWQTEGAYNTPLFVCQQKT